MTKILIAGATGLVGSLALQQALASPRVTQVIALTRRPIAPHPKLQNIVLNFANLPADAPCWAVDGVICALGTTRAATKSPTTYRAIDHGYPLTIAAHARTHGATHFALTSSLGANAASRFAYPRLKGELERDLKTLNYPSLTIVRPSMLAGHRTQPRFGEHIATILFKILSPLLPRRLRISPASAVAALLLEAATTAPHGVHLQTNEDMN